MDHKHKYMDYQPIESYGIIGNLETVALVGLNGSIDFLCYPSFDSPSVFARLLDKDKGGYFQIAPTSDDMTCKQMYLPDTNILITRFLSPKGIVEIIDFMPLSRQYSHYQLVRIVKSIQGDSEICLHCYPAFDYAREKTNVKLQQGDYYSALLSCDKEGIAPGELFSEVPLEQKGNGVYANFTLQEGQQVLFSYFCGDIENSSFSKDEAMNMLEETAAYWRNWLSKMSYDGLELDHVKRSALALKLLFSKQHGSIVAAPTFGLPEAIGGIRNWDYRYCWIRDSSFTIYTMLKLGFTDEATDYIKWILQRYAPEGGDGSLQLMYRVDGGADLEEEELDHLEGYRGSRPVRIGNAAKNQFQLDIYGELIDSIYLAHKFSTPMSYSGWGWLTKAVSYVCENWSKPDEGIWEFRGGKKPFLHSRLMCWVAIDRGIRLSDMASLPAPIQEWREVRDTIYRDIHECFWNEELQTFVQYKGAKTVDASVLLMPLVKFISPVDPRWLATMETIKEHLVTDAFVKRYSSDCLEFEGLDNSKEGNFTMCSFWYCECLARAGQINEARLLFEKMMGYANHVGLYAEELGFQGQHLGNFPQAITHFALISAALSIERGMKNGGKPF